MKFKMEDNNTEIKKAYSEVIAVLRLIEEDEKFEKLPMEFIELIRSKADPLYMPQLSKEKSIGEQGLRNETYSILAWIANKYWNENIYEDGTIEEIEKENIAKNDNINENECIISVYNDIEEECLELKNENSILPIAIKDLNWFARIKIKIKMIFDKIFKRKQKKDFNYEI